ncbi:MAG: hypothetical protein OIN86_11080 [Candidatus Methanoperedens sp.]|nr:hypothetical protein [Candidatus Methanoperedens sp.]CAG0993966.1 2-aminoadipate transaminase [Methanosarcinales archaeon]
MKKLFSDRITNTPKSFIREILKVTEGGIFLWITLPETISSIDIFNRAIKENVAFVPGSPFYVGAGGENTLRLNFLNSNEERIEEGIKRLAKIIEKYLPRANPMTFTAWQPSMHRQDSSWRVI